MKRYILTGTPGVGKTAILRWLELDGYGVVEEAATDIIALQQAQGVAEPWTRASFIDSIVNLQRERQLRAARLGDHKTVFRSISDLHIRASQVSRLSDLGGALH